MKIVLCFEDITLTATRDDKVWHVWIVDSHSGRQSQDTWTDADLGYVTFLMIAGQCSEYEQHSDVISIAYSIAEPLMLRLDPECRCIP